MTPTHISGECAAAARHLQLTCAAKDAGTPSEVSFELDDKVCIAASDASRCVGAPGREMTLIIARVFLAHLLVDTVPGSPAVVVLPKGGS